MKASPYTDKDPKISTGSFTSTIKSGIEDAKEFAVDAISNVARNVINTDLAEKFLPQSDPEHKELDALIAMCNEVGNRVVCVDFIFIDQPSLVVGRRPNLTNVTISILANVYNDDAEQTAMRVYEHFDEVFEQYADILDGINISIDFFSYDCDLKDIVHDARTITAYCDYNITEEDLYRMNSSILRRRDLYLVLGTICQSKGIEMLSVPKSIAYERQPVVFLHLERHATVKDIANIIQTFRDAGMNISLITDTVPEINNDMHLYCCIMREDELACPNIPYLELTKDEFKISRMAMAAL